MKPFHSLLLFFFVLTVHSQCPSWQTNLNQFGPDGVHFKDLNTAETLDGTGDLIVTGTRFNSAFTLEELFVARISGTDGQRIWIKTYNNVQASRGFDVTVFLDGTTGIEKLAITGYINDNSTLNKVYIAVMDTANGTIIQDDAFIINPSFHSQGLNIIYTQRAFNGVLSSGFVVAGYTTGNYDPLVASNTQTFILRTDINLTPLFTTILSSPTTANSDFDMANEVIETSNGFFVTGSVNEANGSRQGVLVVKLDEQGSIVWQNNYIYGNDRDKGVDAYYELATDQIYLLTYYSVNHYFGFTAIDNTTGSINTGGSYVYMNGSNFNRTGFKIMPSNNSSFPNDLIILGYERDGTILEPDNTILLGNSVPFAITVNKISGAVNRFRTYPVPYQDPNNYLDTFRFWDGPSPLIYHPEIGFPSAGGCYVMVANRSYGSDRTAIETFTLDMNLNNECQKNDLIVNLTPFSMTSETVTSSSITATAVPITLIAQGNGSETQGCTQGGTLATTNYDKQEIKIFPLPASEILKIVNLSTPNATYQIFDTFGKVILTGGIFENEIQVSSLNSGVYFIKISEESNIIVKKIIKK